MDLDGFSLDVWIYAYMNQWIYGYMDVWINGYVDIYISEVGGSEPNREIVSFRSCMRARGLVVMSELGKMVSPCPFSFSLLDQECSSSEFCGVLVSPSEI